MMSLRGFALSFTRRIGTDNISFLAGGVAFYGLFATFPAMAAIAALFGVFTKAKILREQLEASRALFPPEVYEILSSQLIALTQQSNDTLGIAAIISIIIAIVSATRGTKAMLAALNIVFRVQESRPWWLRQALALLITFGGLMMLMLAIFLIVAVPLIVGYLPPNIVENIKEPLGYLRWLFLGGSVFGGLTLLFALGPCKPIREQKVSATLIGAAVAAGLWIAGAVGGSWAAQLVPQLHAAYGSLSAVIALMFWMLISAYAVLAGAAVTATLDKSAEADAAEDRA